MSEHVAETPDTTQDVRTQGGCHPRCTLGPSRDHPGYVGYRCIGPDGHSLPWLGEDGTTVVTATPLDSMHTTLDAARNRIARPTCPLCGPGYRIGDEGCRHTEQGSADVERKYVTTFETELVIDGEPLAARDARLVAAARRDGAQAVLDAVIAATEQRNALGWAVDAARRAAAEQKGGA